MFRDRRDGRKWDYVDVWRRDATRPTGSGGFLDGVLSNYGVS
jgi:hypothetical protein